MAEQVKVLALGEHRFAAEVHEANETTHHEVRSSQKLLDDLAIPEPDEQQLVAESVKYLLQKVPVTSVPEEIDLNGMEAEDGDYLAEIRVRMST
ncbi:hypothetical protein [Parasphingorhabdus pacifica]